MSVSEKGSLITNGHFFWLDTQYAIIFHVIFQKNNMNELNEMDIDVSDLNEIDKESFDKVT